MLLGVKCLRARLGGNRHDEFEKTALENETWVVEK